MATKKRAPKSDDAVAEQPVKKAAAKGTSKKAKLQDLPAQEDPRAALDPAQLLRAAQPVLKTLAEDLLERARSSAAVTSALTARHGHEVSSERTAEPYDVWLRAFVEQVAAAWLLSCVFVRVLEDRGLVDQQRIAGQGALDSQQLFFELAPSLSERDYLLMVFRELSELPAGAQLFDARHNPVWLLTPSAEGARTLLQLFRTPSPQAPALRFGQADTRFLGDLYQDLSEDVRKRYALLQTPHFVESFILDRTLERAIERFGLNDTTLIDPTCGSGHFLLGAFERLIEHRRKLEPGIDDRGAALKALDAVSGADINPYAIAIARFRLTLAFLEKAQLTRLKDVPRLPLHLAVADSLLHNPQAKTAAEKSTRGAQVRLAEQETLTRDEKAAFDGSLYALEDPAAAKDVLERRYAAVVGNPPYITVKDKAKRDVYRRMYSTCHREYSLAVPFKERFFQLARHGGSVGMITANSFMKREFGTKVIEDFLPEVNLDLIVNTAGAYIPGHGTPTVLLFGTAEAANAPQVLTVLSKRGEPTTPSVPEEGLVWSSIAKHWTEAGFENEYISVDKLPRATLSKHPWSLGGGGAAELKELLEERAEKRLGDIVDAIGFSVITGEDNVLMQPRSALVRAGVRECHVRRNVIGEEIRDWSVGEGEYCIWPYTDDGERLSADAIPDVLKFLWPYRRPLQERKAFGRPIEERGLPWWALREVYSKRMRTPLTITFAFVATHNHFVLDRGGKVFNRSAPIIKLPEGATEDDHLALLAYLNSSTACFWMKQVFFPKTSGTNVGDVRGQEHRIAYEFAGTGLAALPIPPRASSLVPYARLLSQLADERQACEPWNVIRTTSDGSRLSEALTSAERRWHSILGEMVAVQEALDSRVYSLFGLSEERAPDPQAAAKSPCAPADRAFLQGEQSGEAGIMETALYKRPWFGRQGVFHRDERSYRDLLAEAAREWVRLILESVSRELTAIAPASRIVLDRARTWAELAGSATDATAFCTSELQGESVPYLASLRYSEIGLEKRAAWERTWDLQRREDAGEKVGDIPIPPKYDPKDFRKPEYFRLRGKLDVPKERFISYPGCESDEDREPLYGWAGWDHLQQAQALANLYEQRKSEGWERARVTPMLAGILELLPWVKQWHNEPNADFDGQRLGDYFENYLDGECATWGSSREDLRAWRPESGRGKKS